MPDEREHGRVSSSRRNLEAERCAATQAPDALARLAATACRVLDADAAWIAAHEGDDLRVVAAHPRAECAPARLRRVFARAEAVHETDVGVAAADVTISGESVGVLAVRDARERRPDALADLASVAGSLLRDRSRLDPAEAAAAALAAALELHDGYTADHAQEVLALACRVGTRLRMSAADLRDLAFAARLHDVGKLAIDDAILNKPGPLQGDEWSAMCSHPVVGAATIAAIPGLEAAAALVRSHHERWDGSGYPDGLAGEEIPVGSRILAVCDAYRAIVEDRPYRDAAPRQAALAELERHSGAQFDPAVVGALRRVLGSRA
jgi:HD-GYP domain-containing protein (c-di-GMP phosphodiesterase class II)